MNSKVELNKYGFYSLETIPGSKELEEYYSKKYYQEEVRHDKNYDAEEIQYINNKISQKYMLIKGLAGKRLNQSMKFLELGSGEGWTLSFFKKKSWDITGVDFSDHGCKNHNPVVLPNLIVDNIYEATSNLIEKNKKFDVIWLDNVLEHVVDPFMTLKHCRELSNPNAILMIEVPNDYSILQQIALEEGLVDREYWLASPEHISYFNKNGLISLCEDTGWSVKDVLGDFPIDMNIMNQYTNYIMDSSIGKGCHKSRVKIENILHNISIEKANNFFRSLADLGLGRDIIAIAMSVK